MGFLRRGWFSYMFNFKDLFKNLIYILGFSATVASFYLTIYNPIMDTPVKSKMIILLVFMLINLAIALFLSLPRPKININVSNKIDLNIYFDDLFNQNGIIVIPVNEYFDTVVDEKIISSTSVHGQFIKRIFGGNIEDLVSQINKELELHKEKEIIERPRGNCKKYDLGTTISVNKDGKDYFLVAFTRFNDNNKAESFNVEYQRTLNSLLNFIHSNSQGKNINIPLIGAGQSGINLTKQKLLEYLLFSIQIHDQLTISGSIGLVLNEKIKKEINLKKIKNIYSI